MAQATFSCPFGAIHLENRRGTAPRRASAPVPFPRSPGPPLRETLSLGGSPHPARAVQLIVCASPPLPLAGILEESLAGWTKKARLVQAAVEVGSDTAGGETPPLRKSRGLRCRGGLWPPAVYHRPNSTAPAAGAAEFPHEKPLRRKKAAPNVAAFDFHRCGLFLFFLTFFKMMIRTTIRATTTRTGGSRKANNILV